MSSNLPIQLTRFIGRQQEIADIKHQLAKTRLLTLTGPGGCGKTRLAVEVAAQVKDRYEGGATWVDLASITDESLVAQAVAKAVNVKEQPGRSVREALADFLSGEHILLLVDNCEHLIAACARLAGSLVSVCPELHILTTSREPLTLAGEIIYPVPALSLPSSAILAEIGSLEMIAPGVLEALSGYEAVTLFLDRAASVVPGFTLAPENARAIADICTRLDGMPLAIELAAAWVNVLTADQIAARLDNRFILLSSDKRDVIDQRHQTLRAAIDWSYDLLTEPEQILLLRLSVFAGGCSLATAETVCAGDSIESEQVLELLLSLINKSLISAQTLQRGDARYALLETIRQYASEKLIDSGEWSELHDRHLGCFLQLTEETGTKLRGAYQQLWLNWLEGEYDNIRAALRWSLKSGQIEQGLRIAIALYQFWTIRDYVEEGLDWTERLLAQADAGISLLLRANALTYASMLAGFRGNRETQMVYGREAAALAEATGDEGKPALAWALVGQAYAARAAGDYQSEYALVQRVIQLYREIGDLYLLGVSLSTYSFTAMSLGKFDAAHAMLDEALPLLRDKGDPYRIAMALNFSGDLARCEQKYAEAQPLYEESISLLREINAVRDLASALHNLGHTCLHLGDVEPAHDLFNKSMAIQQAQQNTPGVAECLIGFAALAITRDLPAAGVRLLAAAVAIGGQRIASMWAATRMEYEGYLARARNGLSEEEFQAEQAAGRTLSLEQAVAYAQDVALEAAAKQEARKKLDSLTPREREVAMLIAQARSNGEIAEELVVSKRTIETHVSNIRSKLGFTKRAQIVRWAIETGLVQAGGK